MLKLGAGVVPRPDSKRDFTRWEVSRPDLQSLEALRHTFFGTGNRQDVFHSRENRSRLRLGLSYVLESSAQLG